MTNAAPSEVHLFNEDCLAGMKSRLSDGEADVVVTSPPYNVGTAYLRYKDRLSTEDYLSWLESVALEIKRVLKDDGSFFLNIGGTPQNPWVALDAAQKLRNHFVLQNQIVWIKSVAIPKSTVGGKYARVPEDMAVGHYKPINSARYLHNCYEYIFHFTKSGDVSLDRLAVGVPYQDKSNIGRWGNARADRRCRGNTWFIPYKTIRSRDAQRPHPATFPVELAEMCIRLHGVDRAKKVLDPFLGIGSTALACRRLGVSFIGFEIDPDYLAEAENFLEKEREI